MDHVFVCCYNLMINSEENNVRNKITENSVNDKILK